MPIDIKNGTGREVRERINKAFNDLDAAKLDSTAKAANSDKLDGLDSSSFVQKALSGIGADNAPVISNLDDTTMLAGFWRTNEQTTGTFPKPYGGSRHAHVIVERVDANWIKQTIVQISQDGTRPIFYRTNNRDRGWHPWKEVVTADGYNIDILKEATSNSSSNTLVKRDVNGDFVGRWITADHFLMRTEAQDKNLDANSEICFRNAQASKNSPSHMRFATLAKFKEALGLSRGSVGASGWVGLPTGLILQWGQIQNLGVGEEREIMFPIVFPNWTLSVVATPGLPSPNNGIYSVHINGFFKEKFTIQNTDTDSAYPAYWIAIGH
nr:MAG TPA: putative tail fiber protein [Caudoviricetes sp.]